MSSANSSPLARRIGSTSSEASDDEEDENRPGGVPGDGICPSILQFDAVYSATYDAWSCPQSESVQFNESCDIFQVDAFLDLVEQIPSFAGRRLDGLQLRTQGTLLLEYALELHTTDHTECNQSTKVLKSFQCLRYETPTTCKPLDASLPRKAYPGLTDCFAKYLSSLVLAWSYILSCRWVELLQKAGLDASFQRLKPKDTGENFWGSVFGCRWRAILVYNSKTYYAPWTLRFTEGQEPMA